MIHPEQRAELRKKAEGASAGDWHIRHDDEVWVDGKDGDPDRYVGGGGYIPDAAYIVAAQPSTVLALLDRIEELEGALGPFVALVKSHDDAGISFLRSDQAEASARLTDDELAELFAPANEVALTDGAMRSPVKITWGDFRRARKALSGEKP